MNHKQARIRKLIIAGLSNEQIIRTIGHQDTPEIQKRIEAVRKDLINASEGN